MAALTAVQAADRVHEALDDLARDLDTLDDGTREIGDYTYPLEDTLRDCGFSSISEATSNAQVRAVLRGMEYYVMSRLLRKYLSRTNQQQGAGASGMHLSMEWAATGKTLRANIAAVKQNYDDALNAIGVSPTKDPAVTGSAVQAVVVDRDRDVGAAILRDSPDGLPWFVESEYQS